MNRREFTKGIAAAFLLGTYGLRNTWAADALPQGTHRTLFVGCKFSAKSPFVFDQEHAEFYETMAEAIGHANGGDLIKVSDAYHNTTFTSVNIDFSALGTPQ